MSTTCKTHRFLCATPRGTLRLELCAQARALTALLCQSRLQRGLLALLRGSHLR